MLLFQIVDWNREKSIIWGVFFIRRNHNIAFFEEWVTLTSEFQARIRDHLSQLLQLCKYFKITCKNKGNREKSCPFDSVTVFSPIQSQSCSKRYLLEAKNKNTKPQLGILSKLPKNWSNMSWFGWLLKWWPIAKVKA